MAAQLDQNSFLTGANVTYLADLYAQYLKDPKSVAPDWAGFFSGMADDARAALAELTGASWARSRSKVVGAPDPDAKPAPKGGKPAPVAAAPDSDAVRRAAQDSVRALLMIRTYRERGHLEAELDPLHLEARKSYQELRPEFYGFTDADMDRKVFIGGVLGLEEATVREIVQMLRDTYCNRIGVEYMHIQDPEQKAWMQERIEGPRNHTDFTVKGKRAIYERIVAAESLERFLDKKYTGTKRFGLDGGEAAVPALEQIMKRGGQLGVQEIVLGMPHRGRLNVLTNVFLKPFQAVFSEFQGNSANPEDVQGSGDVKYHLGTSADRDFDGTTIHLSLTANPSHLEAVNPVVAGKVRAKQAQKGDTDRTKVLGLLLHGDAAFAGQGLVAETLALSDLRGYRTGGTIHFVINNQIGFTTAPSYSRFTPYCTDLALAVQAPVFHVNGDDPESVVHVARIAIEFRQRFKRDVVIDLVCYRRFGHNEGDDPGFTNPLMYKAIAKHPTTRELYERQLVKEGVMTQAEADGIVAAMMKTLDEQFTAATSYKPNKADWLEGAWKGMTTATDDDRRGETALPIEVLKEVGYAISRPPENFDVNRKILRQLDAKRAMFDSGTGIDWATAEAMAFGTLAIEGHPTRLSGQDCGRGTFSQRHSVLVDQSTEARYLPINNIRPGKQALYEVHDSPLSEAAVLGFEYGYSLAEPKSLVLWEGQFGDFVNGAQVLIDQFICSAESKWLRMSGLVMLLPHGYEGAGPEHSSARPERFLAACAEDNIQVVNCSTPANYFHVLRRQLKRSFRKPLVIFTPKSLLRLKACQSDLVDFGPGSSFHRVLPDPTNPDPSKVKRVVLCTGKVYYDLAAEREKRGVSDVALVRVEQLYPFPAKTLGAEIARYGKKAEVVWCQEEPYNMGYWFHVDRLIEGVLADIGQKAGRPRYVGRPASAAPATGLLKRHNKEQADLIDAALRVA
ncbi:MAG: 2-oxoglutarate dehydrogenase E1 component [Alphaproteobacteria bacterium]|nr:2-oxoglutarate dehydrogenase E1 component [Alphaproteobacteria bacterium]